MSQPGTPVTSRRPISLLLELMWHAPGLAFAPDGAAPGAGRGAHTDLYHVHGVEDHAPDDVDTRAFLVVPVHGLVVARHIEAVQQREELDVDHAAVYAAERENLLHRLPRKQLKAALAVDDRLAEDDQVRQDLHAQADDPAPLGLVLLVGPHADDRAAAVAIDVVDEPLYLVDGRGMVRVHEQDEIAARLQAAPAHRGTLPEVARLAHGAQRGPV